ncbi:MAG: hypothetical protein KC421_11530, partial [Anaerolineales bacterium]|nr:hypothetical protein [Anaerolineales bacterium]
RNVLIENNTGTAVINLTNSTINTAQNEDGFFVIGGSNGGNNANITLNVTDSSFTHNGAGQLKAHAEDSSTVDVNITGNDFDGQPDVVGDFGIDLAVRDNANLTFDVIGTGANPQTFQPIRSHAINVYASGGGTASGTIDGNVIQESRVGAGVRVVAQVTDVVGFNPSITIAVQNNTISNIQGAGLGGIHIESRDGTSGLSGTANVQATLNNNSVTINGADSVIQALINGGNTMCLDVTNNSAAGAATSPFAGFGSTHYIGNPIPGNPLGGGNVTYDGYISGNLGGTWNANGNTPTLAAGISGEAYVDGTQPTNGTCATVAATANATTVVDAANAHTSTWAFADKIAAMQAGYQTAPASAKQANGESTALAAKDNNPVEVAAVATDKAASTAKPAQSGETVNVALGLLDPGQVVVITFDVTVDVTIPANVGQVCNQGVVSGDNFANVLTDDPNVGGVTDPTCTTLPRVDIEVTISDNPDPLEAGANGGVNNLVHTITVKNNGP